MQVDAMKAQTLLQVTTHTGICTFEDGIVYRVPTVTGRKYNKCNM